MKLRVDLLVVDLRSMRDHWWGFFKSFATYQYGPQSNVIIGRVVNQFDGLIYLDDSPAMNSVVWGKCGE
jgi:hypothetical protein